MAGVASRRHARLERDDHIQRRLARHRERNADAVPAAIGVASGRVHAALAGGRPAGLRYLDTHPEVDDAGMAAPRIGRHGTRRHEMRSGRRAHPVLDRARRVAEQGFQHLVTNPGRTDPPDGGEVVGLVGVFRDGRSQPKRERAAAKMPDRSAQRGRHARRARGTQSAAGCPRGMPDGEERSHDSSAERQVHPAAGGALHQRQLVMEGPALLLERRNFHAFRRTTLQHRLLQRHGVCECGLARQRRVTRCPPMS